MYLPPDVFFGGAAFKRIGGGDLACHFEISPISAKKGWGDLGGGGLSMKGTVYKIYLCRTNVLWV